MEEHELITRLRTLRALSPSSEWREAQIVQITGLPIADSNADLPKDFPTKPAIFPNGPLALLLAVGTGFLLAVLLMTQTLVYSVDQVTDPYDFTQLELDGPITPAVAATGSARPGNSADLDIDEKINNSDTSPLSSEKPSPSPIMPTSVGTANPSPSGQVQGASTTRSDEMNNSDKGDKNQYTHISPGNGKVHQVPVDVPSQKSSKN